MAVLNFRGKALANIKCIVISVDMELGITGEHKQPAQVILADIVAHYCVDSVSHIQEEPAFVIVAVVVFKCNILTLNIRIKGHSVIIAGQEPVGIIHFIVPEYGVFTERAPDTGVTAVLGTAAGSPVGSSVTHIVFNYRPIHIFGHNTVALHIADRVIGDIHIRGITKGRIPHIPVLIKCIGSNAAFTQVMHVIALYAHIIVLGGRTISGDADSPEEAFHITVGIFGRNIEHFTVFYVNMFDRTLVFIFHPDAGAAVVVVGHAAADAQVIDLPVTLVNQGYHFLIRFPSENQRFFTLSVAIQLNGCSGAAGSFGREPAVPGTSGFEQNPVTRLKNCAVHFVKSLPGGSLG